MVKNRRDFDSITLDSDNSIKRAVKYVKEYKLAVEKRKSKIAVGCVFGCLLDALYDSLVGMNDFMMMVYKIGNLLNICLKSRLYTFPGSVRQ